ncbi:MAG: thioredoxin domain-containing protein [Acidimicrobiia bacterium]|nr:thioredoxin domain-containing protein [Acidimicrobiia bacterium]
MNRLAAETSPYLRQHRENPVDWYPWGDEVFERAVAEDKPVLLSVGYSACHWCHVMAHESFEDDATAALMNANFVNVKVDREERPDVDAIYMDAVQALSGRGGWPMTVFLTPSGEPFFGGTYFPPEPRHGMPSFSQLLESVTEAWNTQRDDLLEQAGRLTDAITSRVQLVSDDSLPGIDVLDQAAVGLRQHYDPAWGGFGPAPKFPQAMSLDALFRVHDRTGDTEVLAMVTNTLDAMASGGMYDHLGGGFARYSVDDRWMVPHFEKMLYDNALLARAYLHAWQVTGEARYRQVLDETIGYVTGELRHPDGGFYSAEDADSEGEEGKFYVFTPDEVRAILGADAGPALEWFGISAAGNFEGKNIPWRPRRGDLIRSPEIDRARSALYEARATRVRPGLDDKVLTEWNALFLATLAEAALATGTQQWLDAAIANGEFLVANLRRDDGRWMRSWQAGDDDRPARAKHLAYAHDHAALVDAFTRLGEATGQRRWIEEARAVADRLIELFWDDENGGVYTTGRDAEQLITRPKDIMDNATPSANSLAAVALLRLSALTGDESYRDRAEEILRMIGRVAADHPMAFGHLLGAIDLHQRGAIEVAVTGDRHDLVRTVATRYRPTVVLAWGEPYDSPLWADRDQGLAYVCRDFACRAPTSDVDTLDAQLATA